MSKKRHFIFLPSQGVFFFTVNTMSSSSYEPDADSDDLMVDFSSSDLSDSDDQVVKKDKKEDKKPKEKKRTRENNDQVEKVPSPARDWAANPKRLILPVQISHCLGIQGRPDVGVYLIGILPHKKDAALLTIHVPDTERHFRPLFESASNVDELFAYCLAHQDLIATSPRRVFCKLNNLKALPSVWKKSFGKCFLFG
jgi:hypothetical protein